MKQALRQSLNQSSTKMVLLISLLAFGIIGVAFFATTKQSQVVDAPTLLNLNYQQVVARLGEPIEVSTNPRPVDSVWQDHTKHGTWKIKDEYKLLVVFDLQGKAAEMLFSKDFKVEDKKPSSILYDEERYLSAANLSKKAATYQLGIGRHEELNGLIYAVDIRRNDRAARIAKEGKE
jgi:hypothetical protein